MEPKYKLGQKVWIKKYAKWMGAAKIQEVHTIAYKRGKQIKLRFEYVLFGDQDQYQEDQLMTKEEV